MAKLVLNAKLHNFSASTKDSEWEIIHEDFRTYESILLYHSYIFLFYANGNCKENAGYVSIIFEHSNRQLRDLYNDPEVHCHVSIVDVAENKRFTQSIVYVYDDTNLHDFVGGFQFGLEKFLKRETLLNNPDELLPGDCLTVCVDVDFIYHNVDRRFDDNFLKSESIFSIDKYRRKFISLDTRFGRDLCRESMFFRSASDNPFIESRIRKVRIQDEEEDIFVLIFAIFYGYWAVGPMSIQDICDLYRVADKYDIQSVIETCRQFVKAVLRAAENSKYRECVDECVQEISKLENHYSDEDMKKAVDTYLESIENFGTDDYTLGQHLKKKLYTEWKCEFTREINSETPSITMERIEGELEFYQ